MSGEEAAYPPATARNPADGIALTGATARAALSPDVKPDQEHLCDRPAPHKTNQGVPQPQDWAGHGLEADDVGAEEMA